MVNSVIQQLSALSRSISQREIVLRSTLRLIYSRLVSLYNLRNRWKGVFGRTVDILSLYGTVSIITLIYILKGYDPI